MFSEEEKKELDAEVAKYERPRAAAVEAMKILQERRGWVSDEGIGDLAKLLGMTPEELDGLATFYPFIFRRPVGRHVIFICDSVSCWIMGYDGVLDRIKARLGVGLGETTADGNFTILPVSCIGRCDHAPALIIDRDLHLDVDPDRLERILEEYE